MKLTTWDSEESGAVEGTVEIQDVGQVAIGDKPITIPGTPSSEVTLGNASDLWGGTPTPDDLNAGMFVSLTVQEDDIDTAMRVDAIGVRVTYTEAASSSSSDSSSSSASSSPPPSSSESASSSSASDAATGAPTQALALFVSLR